jgi:hypothetical protein
MTTTEAAEQWLRAKPAAKLAQAEVDEAEKVLKEYFERTGRTTYRNKVGITVSAVTNLDTKRVREDHGDRYDVAGQRRTLTDLRSATAKTAAA